MSATEIPAAVVSRFIDASPDDVFDACIDPDLLAKWFAPGEMKAEVHELDANVGGRFRISMHDSEKDGAYTAFGEYVRIERAKQLVFTWNWEFEGGSRDSLVTLTFTPNGDGTDVELRHEKLPNEAEVTEHTKGWTGCLENLVALFATA